MYSLTEIPGWIVIIFSLLCLFQVRNWFDEIIESFSSYRKSFILEGQRYALLPNRSFIMDESLKAYGLDAHCSHKLN